MPSLRTGDGRCRFWFIDAKSSATSRVPLGQLGSCREGSQMPGPVAAGPDGHGAGRFLVLLAP